LIRYTYISGIIICVLFFSCTKKSVILFEDDFENHTIGKIPGTPWKKTGNGIAIIDTSRAFSGNQSVHFSTGAGYRNRAFIGLDHLFPLKKNKYYGSLHMYVEEASPNGIHWTMIQSSGKVKDKNYSSQVRYGGQHHKKLMANYETKGVKSDCWQHSEVKIPEKTWFTLQWHFDGNHNKMQLWLNGKIIESISTIKRGNDCLENDTNGIWKFPVFENILVGWVDYQTGGGNRHVWIDDVIISTNLLE